jgi:hypothetical protein
MAIRDEGGTLIECGEAILVETMWRYTAGCEASAGCRPGCRSAALPREGLRP